MGKDEESIKDMVFRKIFDKNPFLEWVDKENYTKQPLRKDQPFWELKYWAPGRNVDRIDPKNLPMPRIQYEAHIMNIFPSAIAPTGLSDELFNLIGDRAWNHCYDIEKAALGCLEYYGCKRGLTICADHYDDFHECMSRDKQYLRSMAMMSKRRMRYREYLAGKRDYDTVFIPLPPDGIYKDPAPAPKDKFHQEWR